MTLVGVVRPPRTLMALSLVLAAASCRGGATIVEPAIEVVVASGDQQYGTTGAVLGNPLRVTVRTLSGRVPRSGTTVTWEIVEGAASFQGLATTTTDETGSAEVRVRLGGSTGRVAVQAMAQGVNNPTTTFELFTVDTPVLTAVEPSAADPGQELTLTGLNFSPTAEQNVVLFSGVRGEVTAASPTELTVRVPGCLPERSVSVSVQLGVVASGTLPVAVGPGGALASLPVGGVFDVAEDAEFTCLGLAGSGAEYLAVVYSGSTVGAARHPFSVRGVSSTPPPLAPPAPLAERRPLEAEPGQHPQLVLDRALREREEALVGERSARHPLGSVLAPRRAPPALTPPTVGERRSFQVFSGENEFDEVTAVARLVSDQAAIFVDERAPANGFTAADLQSFADRFDDVIHPEVTGLFGSVSDLDENERVVILFTPVVNRLTPRGSSGFIGGFFFGIDLLPEQQGSNRAEVFYALVPDPSGLFSDPRTKEAVLDVVPAVLAHEFQHMVGFNERILVRSAEATEAVWLSEGLAQYAEELVALEYERLGDPESVELFRSGTRTRARRYLQRPDTVSLIISTGQGSLAERGAGHLFVTYLAEQESGDLIGRLTRTTRTGVGNVEAETGRVWESLLADWWAAVHLDGSPEGSGALHYPDSDLRELLGDPFPLEPTALGGVDFDVADSLWSSSAGYYIVIPPQSGSIAIRLGGERGAPSAPQAVLRMRVIRVK